MATAATLAKQRWLARQSAEFQQQYSADHRRYLLRKRWNNDRLDAEIARTQSKLDILLELKQERDDGH